MLELGIGADIARGVGWVLWIAIFGAILFALRVGKTWKQRLFFVGLILALLISPFLPNSYRNWEYRQRYQAAKAVFDERCKGAGEKIYKTVDDVAGVLLINVRPRASDADWHDKNWPDAGIASDHGGDGYIVSFLGWEKQQHPPTRGIIGANPKGARDWFVVLRGYSYVDVKEPDGIYRYRLQQPGRNDLLREPSPSNPARYAVSYRNHVDPADRAHWVAGTVVTITDTSNNQVIAEKIWYSFEPGLGSTAGHRLPWAFAIQCPSYKGWQGAQTRMFVDQILKPKQGE